MDRLDAMAALVAAVDAGSLAGAARRLNRSPASVTRAVAVLEARLGTRLLHRTTRSLSLTVAGERFVATCRQVLGELAAAERGAALDREDLGGPISVTAPVLFGQMQVRPVLDRFLDAHPGVRARLLLLDRVVNLVEEGVDLAVRLAHLPDSELVASRLGEVRRVVCASPAYLERRGEPLVPSELPQHDCIVEGDAGTEARWSFRPGPGDARRSVKVVPVRPRLIVNSAAAAIGSALDGHGLTRVLSYQVTEHVRARRLVLVLRDHEPRPVPVHLVLPPFLAMTARTRAFVNYVTPALRAALDSGANADGQPVRP